MKYALLIATILLSINLSQAKNNGRTTGGKNLEKTQRFHKKTKKSHAYITSYEWHPITKRTFQLETKVKGVDMSRYKLGERYSKVCKRNVPQYYKAYLVVK